MKPFVVLTIMFLLCPLWIPMLIVIIAFQIAFATSEILAQELD
jgi:hypothetical protein